MDFITAPRIRTIPYLLLVLCPFVSSPASAQTAPWTTPIRGSWVQTGPTAQGDIVLAAQDSTSQIVVGDDENAAVRQAAEFLASDIEKISGHRPQIVKTPGDRVNIRLVTLGHGEVPAAVDTRAMQGQWESYRIVTAGRDVWLVGSNPRGTAFAAYTLSERLGIDPLYIWTGSRPSIATRWC